MMIDHKNEPYGLRILYKTKYNNLFSLLTFYYSILWSGHILDKLSSFLKITYM